MSRLKTKPKTFKLTVHEEKAIQELALAGHLIDPTEFPPTEVGVIRRAIREAWRACPKTTEKPFPGEE